MTNCVDSEKLERLFASHGDRIYSFCLRLCANSADAEDLAAEVFLDAPVSLRRFRGEASEETLLYRIALNKHRNMLRSRFRQLRRTLNLPQPEQNSEVAIVSDVVVAQALQQLSGKHREAFLLVKAEGMPYARAAEVLRVPVGTVQSRVHAAGKRLAQLLDLQDTRPFVEAKNEL